ncbi:toxin glutamine deamidase domain-containing protein [Saccharopolyspora hirsuta]|uniref:toxin glutamine deamidase domain-containing protein n=1 Tax=Saccharopolyspora hirsuta TaxID=1837 RepID=UPI003323A7F9
MAMTVSPEVAKLFQVLTGEEWPDADEDQLRALAGEWTAAAQTLAELGPGLRSAVQAIRADFAGEAAEAFAQRVAPFVEGDDLISSAAELFNGLAKTLLDLALDVEYMKIVTIASLIALLAEIAWAIAMAPFTGGATMSWLAARMAVVRFLIQSLLGRVLMRVLSTAVFSVAFQLLIDAVAQTAQFAMGTRTEWNTDHTKNAAGTGGMAAALALPMAGLGRLFGSGLNGALNAAFAKKFGKDWAQKPAEVLSHIGTESFHEMMTEALYKYATEGEFELNPYAATAGAASGAGSAGGAALGDKLAAKMQGGSGGNGPDTRSQPDTGAPDTTGSEGSREISGGSGGGPTTTPPTSPGTETPGQQGSSGAGGQDAPTVQAQSSGGGNSSSGGGSNSAATSTAVPGRGDQQGAPTSIGDRTTSEPRSPQGNPTQIAGRQDPPAPASSTPQGAQTAGGPPAGQQVSTPSQAVETPGQQGGSGGRQESVVDAPPPPASPVGSSPAPGQQGTTTPGTVEAPQQTLGPNPPQSVPVQQDSPGGNESSAPTAEQPSPPRNTSGQQVVSNPSDPVSSQVQPSQVDHVVPQVPEPTPPSSHQTGSTTDANPPVDSPRETSGTEHQSTATQPSGEVSNSHGQQQGGATAPGSPQVVPPPNQETNTEVPTSTVQHEESRANPADPPQQVSTPQAAEQTSSQQTPEDAPQQVSTPQVVEQTGSRQTPEDVPQVPHERTTVQPPQGDQQLVQHPPQHSHSAQQTSNPTGQTPNPGQVSNPAQHAPNAPQQTSSPAEPLPSPAQQASNSAQPMSNAGQETSNPVQPLPSSAQHASNPGQQPPSTGQQTSAPAQSSVPVQQPSSSTQQPPSSVPQTTSSGQQTSGSTSTTSTPPGTNTTTSKLPPTQSAVQQIGQSSASSSSVAPKTSPSTATPSMAPNGSRPTPSAQQVAATIGISEVDNPSSRTATDSYEMTEFANRRTEIGQQPTQTTSQTGSNGRNNPFADKVAEAERAAEEAADARRKIEKELGAVKAAGTKARHDLVASERSTREARGAAIATQEVSRTNDQRIAQAQQQSDAAGQNLADRADERARARERHQQAVRELTEARTALGEVRDDAAHGLADAEAVRAAEDNVRRRSDTAAFLGERRENAERAHSEAAAAADRAKQELDGAKAVEASANAASKAHDTATSALGKANDAVKTTAEANEAVQHDLRTATTAEDAAAKAVADLKEAVDQANTRRSEADHYAAQADQARKNADELAAQRDGISEDLAELRENPPKDDQQREAWNNRISKLENDLTALENRLTDAQNRANTLENQAEAAENRYDNAAAAVNSIHADINDLRDQANTAESHAADARSDAEKAAEAAEKAKDTAKEAAEQGEFERGLTQLSFLPHGSELQFETLGPRDGLIDALSELTGLDRDRVEAEIGRLGDDALVAAIGDGRIRVGDVDVAVSPDLHRPGDTRTAPPHQQPSTVSGDSSHEHGRPQTESTSTSVPIRIPLMFVSPLDLAGTVVRPMVYVGATGKRAQKFESSVTFTDTSGTSRSYVPTTMKLGLSVPGKPPVEASIDAGLRTPEITRGDAPTSTLPTGDYQHARAVLASVPEPLGEVLGTSREAAAGLTDQLLGPGTPNNVTIGGKPVTILPVGDAQVSYVGTTSVDSSHAVSLDRSWQTTKGSDANFGTGLYGGGTPFYVGGFLDFSSGLTDGSTPSAGDSVTQSSSEHQLVYEVSRDMRVGDGHTAPADGQPQGTVRTQLHVPVWKARELGLPLPPHLTGESTTPAPHRPYRFGRDDIKFVDRDKVTTFLTGQVSDTADGLSDRGRAAIQDKFRSPEVAKNTIYDAMHGGAHASWTKGGRTHFVDIYAIPAAPERTAPSGQQDTSTEVKHTDKFHRSHNAARTARIGAGGAFMPKGDDSPNPNAPKATPEDGLPNPYQGGPTQSTAGPRATAALTWEGGVSNKSGYTAKDGRAAKYGGDMRDYQGPLEFVVVHGSTKNPNWAQHFFLGDRMLFGPNADARYSGPSKADLDRVLAGEEPAHQDIRKGRVDDAIRVSTAADKLTRGTPPPSTTAPGTYLGDPPALPSNPVTAGLFGDYATVEDVRITPNSTEAVDLALAKRIEQLQPDGRTAIRRPPKGSGNWPAWAEKTFTDQRGTDYAYKSSELTRPGTTAGDAVRDFQGRVGSLGTATQGLGELANSTGKMFREGRAQDFNGTLHGEATYHSPRLVDVRAESTLKRNQAGEQVSGSTKSWGVGAEVELTGNVMPKRDGQVGAMLGGVLSGGGKYGRSHAVDVTTGGRQDIEYTGPTALITLDVRYRYWADLALRSMFGTSGFDRSEPLAVTVDEPDGVLVELPVERAIAMFEALGLPVPPELPAMLPTPKDEIANPAHTLLPGPGEYAAYSDTSVTGARLTGDDPLTPVRDRLDQLGVTDPEWRQDVLDQVNAVLNTPAGHQWLQDPMAGQRGLISVPHPGAGFENVVDVRVKATPADRTASPVDGATPDKLTRSTYVSTSEQDKSTTTWSANAAVSAGVRQVETPSVPPGEPGENGQVQQAPPNPGASSGAFTPQVFGGGRSWKTEDVLDGSGSEKVTTKVDTDKVGRTTRPVDYELDITVRRRPMPGLDTLGAGIPKHVVNLDKGIGDPPVRLNGEVDLLSPSSDASPPLRRPANPPEIEVLDGPKPKRAPGFGPDDAFRVESIGTDTARAVHDAMYAQLSGKLPPGATADQITAAAQRTSEFTRPGSNAEYVVHNMVKGSSLHDAADTMFAGGEYRSDNVLGAKHPLYDSLVDVALSGDIRPEDLDTENVTPLPEDTTMSFTRDRETADTSGTTKTVTTSFGPAATGIGTNTHQAAGAAPTSVTAAPPASGTVSSEEVVASSAKDGRTTSTKYEGRSYLFPVSTARIRSDVHVHGTNSAHKPITAVKDFFGRPGHPGDSSVEITAHDDLKVRVWERTALDKGLLTLHDVWKHAGKLPGDQQGYGLTRNPGGATIHPPGRTDPPAGNSAPTGRNLHIAPGVSLGEVQAFVGTLPSDMRPSSYTVDPGQGFTADQVREAVAGLPEPPKPEEPAATEESPAQQRSGVEPSGSRQASSGGSTPAAPPRTDAIGSPSLVAASELFTAVPPGTRFAAPESFVGLLSRAPGPSPVHAALAFHSTYHGNPRIADGAMGEGRGGMAGAAEELGVPPTAVGRGAQGLAEVIDRVTRGGHGSDALVFAFAPDGQANAWNVVNHHGSVSLVDAFTGTIQHATPDLLDGPGELFAIPLDHEGNFIPDGVVLPAQQGTISYQQARQLYDQLAADTFEHPRHGTVTMPTGHPEDGCYIRAHLWASKLQDWGVDVRKVFMTNGQHGLSTISSNAYGATADHPRPISWAYHVAPLVSVDMGNGDPPVEMVFDPAVSYDFASAVGADRAVPYQGVVPVRQWIQNAGIYGGFAESDLYEPRPWLGDEGPVGPDEVRVRITDPHLVGPPWLLPPPASFGQANLMVESFLDTAYEFSAEVAHRNEFKAWHQSLPPHARQAFNQLDAKFDDGALKDFHDWFRSMSHADRARLADWFASPQATVQDLVPPWESRVRTAREGLAALTEEQRAPSTLDAVILLSTYHGQLPPTLNDEMVDVLAYRHHVAGLASADDLARALAVEHGTQPALNPDAVGGPVEVANREPAPPAQDDPTPEPRPRKRSRDDFEADEGEITTYEPPHLRPIPERLVPPAQEDTDRLLAAVPPGTEFADPATFVELINGNRSEQGRDVNCVDAALAFHETYHGNPRVAGAAANGVPQGAGTAAAEALGYAPELFSRGPAGLSEVIDRVTRAGHGADALVVGFPRSGGGHAWNVVNHRGTVSIVDAQAGTARPATTEGFSWLDRVYATPMDAHGNYIDDSTPAPQPPATTDAYATAEYERAKQAHDLRRAAAAGEEIPVPGTTGRLVPGLGGLRLVGAAITAELAADLASLSNRNVIAHVIGPDAEDPDQEEERPVELRFPPRGRPEPLNP